MSNAYFSGRSGTGFSRHAAGLRSLAARFTAKAGSAEGPDWLRFVPADVRGLVERHLPAGLPDFGTIPGQADRPEAGVPAGAQFLSRSFANDAGSRRYKLFVPSGYAGQKVKLVVMLHGCTQSPDDFAAGTGMNDAAEAQTFLVAYPWQTQGDQAQKCWKWFNPRDQVRDQGEPSIIAGITREVMRDFAVDPRQVYVAGLSAGGAAAAVMGAAYPDLFAAIAVHSGLACGAAHDLPSALSAMKRGDEGARTGAPRGRVVPSIVFHGDRDTTVSPLNGDHVVAQATGDAAVATRVTTGQVAGGRRYTTTVSIDPSGNSVAEQWAIHGAGHAWSGGRAAGSYTDPLGPDATSEMLRFFGQHLHPGNG